MCDTFAHLTSLPLFLVLEENAECLYHVTCLMWSDVTAFVAFKKFIILAVYDI